MTNSNKQYRCPQNGCDGQLGKDGTCSLCRTDWADVFKNHDLSDDAMLTALRSGWTAHDTSQHSLLLLSEDFGRDHEMPWRERSERDLSELRNHIAIDGNFTKALTNERVRSFMTGNARRSNEAIGLPEFDSRGDYAGLFLSENDQLYWPFAAMPTPHCKIHRGLYYTGQPFEPKHNCPLQEP